MPLRGFLELLPADRFHGPGALFQKHRVHLGRRPLVIGLCWLWWMPSTALCPTIWSFGCMVSLLRRWPIIRA